MLTFTLEVVTDVDAARLWHGVEVAAHDADHVGLPADPLDEVLPLLSGEAAGDNVELWLGQEGSIPVATAQIWFPRHDNTSAATVDIRVHPGHRRRGHGHRLLSHALDRVRALGRYKVFGEVSEPLADGSTRPTSPGRAFAETVGGRPVLSEIRRVLDVGTLDTGRLAALRSAAAESAPGYSLLTWIDRAPVELLDDLAVLMGRMSTDPPMGEMDWEPEAWDAARYRANEDSAVARGRRRFAAAARHDASDRVVGYTDIGVNAARTDVAYQWDTIVAPEHRGHRLGTLVKAVNLELLRSQLTGVRIVNTWNAEDNTHMVAINDALGFCPVERWTEWQFDLAHSSRGAD